MNDTAILCVDDEPHVLQSLKRLLRKEPYTVYTADSVRVGLDLLGRQSIQLVISDQRMPEMSGVAFLQAVKEVSRDTIRCILSGYVDAELILDSINKGEVFRFLTKPWNDEELKATIRQCLAHHDILRQNRILHEQVRAQNEELRRLNLKMEEMVQLRTRSLRITQEMLENIPLAVIGVSCEGMVLTSNRAADELVGSVRQLAQGAHVNETFPPEAALAISARLKGEPEPLALPVQWNGKRLQLQFKTLADETTIRGCLVILRETTDMGNFVAL